jgi:hypothetical protein
VSFEVKLRASLALRVLVLGHVIDLSTQPVASKWNMSHASEVQQVGEGERVNLRYESRRFRLSDPAAISCTIRAEDLVRKVTPR